MADTLDTSLTGPAAVEDIASAATRRMQRQHQPVASELPIIGNDDNAAFEALAPGTKFKDQSGTEFVKPWIVNSDTDYARVPEGAIFQDAQGKRYRKPEFEGVGFTAQSLYDMSVTLKERKKALEFEYPGKVKEDAEGLYVDDNGTFRRPGRGAAKYTGFAAGAAAPVTGAVLGSLGLGAVGGPVGAVAGGGTGAMLGQGFNDIILGLAGVLDRTPGEELVNQGLAAVGGMAGAGVGRGISMVVPSLKAGVSAAGAALPRAAAHFLGAQPETLKQARQLAEQGVMVPPSAWAHESPHLQNLVEVFDPAFRTNKPLQESAAAYYEQEGKKLLEQTGVQRTESLLSPTSEISTLEAGERIMQRTLNDQATADTALRNALEKRAAEIRSGMPERQAQREAVLKAAEDSRNAAQKLIDQGFKDIDRDAEAAFKIAEAGGKTGELWQNIGNKFQAIRQGISARAKYWYGRYDEMTGGATTSSQELSNSARQMIKELPEEFKARNPSLVQKLEKLGAQYDEHGQLVKEAEELTYGQLHDLRSLFRGSADWTTLSSDFKNGALKRFSNEIDRMIHDPAAPEHVRAAGRFLDVVDKWYAKNIKIFNASQIKAVMKGLEAGEPADPAALYKAIIKEGHTDLIERVKKMVGPNLWAGVKAADTRAMLDAAKTLEPGTVDAKKFVREVLERHRAGLLASVHGSEANKLLEQARAIEQLEGRLPITAQPGDTMGQVIAKARAAEDAAKEAARKDPLGELAKESRRIEASLQNWEKGASGRMRGMRRNDPLAFLYDPTTGGIEAVDRILKDEDLILAAAARFGENSSEFNMLRRIYSQRILQGTMAPGKRLSSAAPEVQQLMFPGTTLKQFQTLADNMDFLMSRRGMARTTAGSMSAMSKVEHPIGGGIVGRVVSKVPVLGTAADATARAIRGKFYALITKLATSPATFRWVEKGLNGTAEERAAVKVFTDAVLQKGSAVGAGVGEAAYQNGLQ